MIQHGAAEQIAGGYVTLNEGAVRLLREMARSRSWNPLRSVRPHRQFGKSLLREWENEDKVRSALVVLGGDGSRLRGKNAEEETDSRLDASSRERLDPFPCKGVSPPRLNRLAEVVARGGDEPVPAHRAVCPATQAVSRSRIDPL